MKSVVVFGAGGQLGSALVSQLTSRWSVRALTRARCDVTDKAAVRRLLEETRPNAIINAAAYTRVDEAERDEKRAMAVNADAAGHLADVARSVSSFFMTYSTDYVFAGDATTPYEETATIAPINRYGQSKAAGESAVRAAGGRSLIIRTAWLYSAVGDNILKTVLRLAREREMLAFVADQIGSPTSVDWLAKASERLLEMSLAQRNESDGPQIIHAACLGQTSWYDFARAVLDGARGMGADFVAKDVKPILTSEYPTPARRPAYSVLSTRLLQERYSVLPLPWRTALEIELGKLFATTQASFRQQRGNSST